MKERGQVDVLVLKNVVSCVLLRSVLKNYCRDCWAQVLLSFPLPTILITPTVNQRLESFIKM